jgi:hypothetical protein
MKNKSSIIKKIKQTHLEVMYKTRNVLYHKQQVGEVMCQTRNVLYHFKNIITIH